MADSISTTLDFIIPEIWERRERTELITRANFAAMVAQYGDNIRVGDTLHIPIIPQLSVNDWGMIGVAQIGQQMQEILPKRKPIVILVLDDKGE